MVDICLHQGYQFRQSEISNEIETSHAICNNRANNDNDRSVLFDWKSYKAAKLFIKKVWYYYETNYMLEV